MNNVFRVYTSPDMLGMELGGSLKNVIALAAGMADGLGYGDNTKAALITRGMFEMNKLAVTMGAKQETLNGLTGIGDLIVTCESKHSRNRKAGMLIGQGYTMQQAMDEAGDALLAALAPLVEEPVSTLVAVKKVDTPVPAYLDGKAIKRVSFCDRAEGVDAATFHDEWWYTHSLLVKLMSGYCGYNQNLVIDRMVQGASVHYADLPVEGMVEFWFEDMDAFDECYSTVGFKLRASVHAAEFIGTVTTYFVEAVPVELQN